MNDIWKYIGSFAAGVTCGAIVGTLLAKKKYRSEYEKAAESVAEYVNTRKDIEPVDDTIEMPDPADVFEAIEKEDTSLKDELNRLTEKYRTGMPETPTASQLIKNDNDLRKAKKLSAKTIKNIHGTLHPALGRAVKNGMIRSNPTDLCDFPKVVKKEITPLEQDDISILLDIWRDSKYRNVFLVTLFTGLRQGEVLGLTWDCVDFENESIYINKQLTKTEKVGGTYCLATTKSTQSRLIFVAPTVIDILRQQKRRQECQAKVAGSCWNNEWNLVFTNELGGHLVHITVYKQFKKFVREAGLDETRFHDLRHSYAVASLESGDDIKTLQENLGHASAAFTMNVYAHASKKMHKRSASNMENYIRSVS